MGGAGICQDRNRWKNDSEALLAVDGKPELVKKVVLKVPVGK